MTKSELNEAYHQLANEACAVQRRLDTQTQHREVFDMFWITDFKKAKKTRCCDECDGQEKEYGIRS